MYIETLSAVENGIAPVALLIGIGHLWKRLSPGGLDALAARRTINTLVMYAFYPGLAYHTISNAKFSLDFIWVPLYTCIGLLLIAGLAWTVFTRLPWFRGLARPELGAVILACSFSNILSMGVSVLQPLHGNDAVRYAIYADILGISPLFWSFGAGLASRLGTAGAPGFDWRSFLKTLVRMPPIWAFSAGFAVNALHLPNPEFVDRAAQLLGNAAIPSMLLTIGLSLSLSALTRRPAILLIACALKLVVMPGLVAAACLPFFGVTDMSTSIVLLAGMPTMMATILLSERFGLDTELLASIMVASTLMFFLTLPVWLLLLA